MAATNTADIRNILLAGHAGSGKTTLVERLLFTAGAIGRMGTVEDGNTVSDFTDFERKQHHSLASSIVHFTQEGKLINLIDTPGLSDFIGHAIAAYPAAETVAVMIDAAKGIETGTRRLLSVAAERNLPRMILINKIDAHELDLEGLVNQIQETFGGSCLPINLPTKDCSAIVDVFSHETSDSETVFSSVPEAHTKILDQVVEVDEELMESYLEGGGDNLPKEKVHAAFEQALREGHLVPICFISAREDIGIKELLSLFVEQCPNPAEGNPRTFLRGEGDEQTEFHAEPNHSKPLLAHVFKVSADPFVGKLGIFRVHQGTLKAKDTVYINDAKKAIRIGHLFRLNGKEHTEVDELGPGEIGGTTKVDEIEFNGVLHSDAGDVMRLLPLPLPKPMYGLAVEIPNHKDESKFGPAVAKLQSEDPTFVVERVAATHQTVARGMGELHLRIILDRLKEQFGIEVETETPKVAYKESIQGKAEGHHRHKKQSGGSGEFGEVYLRVAPLPPDHPDGFEFENVVVGGNIPKNFMPAIEKGVRQVLAEGAIAGYPLGGVRVEVYDGKHHPVDSKEVAFMKAGRLAFIDAIKKASPSLLEPFVEVEITAPSDNMGDIAGDIATKRGRVQDSQVNGDICVVKAVAPLSELMNYTNELKSITGGAGSFAMDFSHDETAPPHIQQEIVAAYKPHEED